MSVIVIQTLLLAAAAALSAPAPAVEPWEAPSADGVGSRLSALETRLAAKPSDAALRHEWENVHVCLRKVRFLLDEYGASRWILQDAAEELTRAETLCDSLDSGRPPAREPGVREEGYYSENDDSFQPFIRYLPPAREGGAPLPLIVFLHGYAPGLNVAGYAYLPQSLVDFAEREGFCLAAPFGRSNTDFQGIGEQDVLRVIAEMRDRYPIDGDRIILSGISMGGMGTWTVGAHYPQLFAGLLIVAGRGDYYFWQGIAPGDVPAYKREMIDAEFAAALAPNLRHTPIFCLHGGRDSLIPVAEARRIVGLVRAVNPDLRYVELEGRDHWIYEESFARPDVREWLRTRRRAPPEAVEFVTYHSRYDEGHWLRLRDYVFGGWPARAAAREAAGELVVEAAGVRRVDLLIDRMPPGLRGLPVRAPAGVAVERVSGADDSPPRREARGPVKEAFLGRFLFVCGSPQDDPAGQARFASAVRDWEQFAKSPPRTAREGDVAPEALADQNVFVFGEPETSGLARAILAASPVRVTPAQFVVGEHAFPRAGNGLYLVYRSPWNAERLAVVQCGIPWGRQIPSNHKYDFLPDYIVYTGAFDRDGSNTALCAGFFDADWRISSDRQTLATRSQPVHN